MLSLRFNYSLKTFAKLLSPIHYEMGQHALTQRSINSLQYMPHASFSQRVPGSNIELVIKCLGKSNSYFFMKENGEFLSSSDRNHMMAVQITPDDKNICRAICTTHPQSNSKTFDVVNLGPGTIENATSTKNQHFGRKKTPMELVAGAGSVEVAQSDNYLTEAIRLGNIDVDTFPENFPEPTKVFKIEFIDPITRDKHFYRTDTDPQAQAFRNLVKQQSLEQILTGEVKEHHIVRVVGIKNNK